MRTLDQLIAQASVFAGLEPTQLELIAGCASNEHVEGGALLLREGEPARRFFLIRRGSVALEVHAPGRGSLTIETLYAGDAIGWSWLFEPYRWQLDARALEPCELIGFDGVCLRSKCEADHELGYELMRRFAANLVARLQATRLQLLDVYGRDRASA
jgi:CRP/FNR family transcriptional regulator, cyclic AMP receptor protein